MTASPIKFGASGWRATIPDDFTIVNVRLAVAAIADHMLEQMSRPPAIIGYDTRFMAEKFADTVAEVLGSPGMETRVVQCPDPTRAITHAIFHRPFDAGIDNTASHNPAEYSAIKFSAVAKAYVTEDG